MPALKTVPIDGMGDFAFLIGQNDPLRSHDTVTLLPNTVEWPAGTVLGKVTATGKFTALAPAAADGSQIAAAILGARRPISTTEGRVVIVARDQPVNGYALTYVNAVTAPQKASAEAALAAAMIMVRY
jgi:Bacteriophage lambda head decoration protein D